MTICAVSTPPGRGGIAMVRVSGPQAIAIVDTLHAGKPLAQSATHTAHFVTLRDPETPSEPLDEAVVTVFRGPRSFTGEDVVEISVHGSLYVQRELINLLIRQGCRLAQPGEFTRRAFTNGRIDLARAEAVADVIASQTRAAHRLAMTQMRGSFSAEITALREQLLELAALLELELDFSEEDVEFASRDTLLRSAEKTLRKVASLADTFSRGKAIKEGIPVAIVGYPNAGKSTLLNAILGDDRAIVSDIPGTTRDTIEEVTEIQGIQFRFIDTAGLREDTADIVETMGIDRTKKALHQARIVIQLIPVDEDPVKTAQLTALILKYLSDDAAHLQIGSKRDLAAPNTPIAISALTGEGIQQLLGILVEKAGMGDNANAEVMVTNARHYEALTNASHSLRRLLDGLRTSLPTDLVAQDLRETLHHLSTITGDITTPDILSTIFSRFCIGK